MVTQGALDGTGTLGAVTVGDGTGSILTNGNGGTGTLTMSSLSFLGVGTANINYGGSPGVVVTGALATNPASGTKKVTINATGAFALGPNDLINYGSSSFSLSDFTLGTVPGLSARATKSLALDGNNIALVVAADIPVWTGANGGTWTTTASNSAVSGTPNWALLTAHTPSDFWAGDIVQFNDTVDSGSGPVAPTTTTVTIHGGNVSPTSATFNNSALNYTVTTDDGSGIATGSLSKNGHRHADPQHRQHLQWRDCAEQRRIEHPKRYRGCLQRTGHRQADAGGWNIRQYDRRGGDTGVEHSSNLGRRPHLHRHQQPQHGHRRGDLERHAHRNGRH